MAKVSFSGKNKSLVHDIEHHNDVRDALILFCSNTSPLYESRFFGMRPKEVDDCLAERLNELDLTTTMSLLASVEAILRIDYLKRCYQKKRDHLSKNFRDLYLKKGERASLEDDILEVWKEGVDGSRGLVGDLRGAFKFRHWLAHGRYWTPKFGRKYDYFYIYQLAVSVLQLPLIR